MKHHISYFYNARFEYYPSTHCIKRGVKQSSSSTEKTNCQSQDLFKMSTIGTNTSTQACWPLVNRVINERLLQALPRMQQTLSQLISVVNVTVTLYLHHM